ncbi:MAG: ABC transporter substrate-binding protein [Anaerolineae bacterium]|nr:ABC transporter substrate-binding protein [Anaerolineae bacterium]
MVHNVIWQERRDRRASLSAVIYECLHISHLTLRISQFIAFRFTLLLILFLLTACFPPPLPRVLKIGLVAPFEGRYRYIGYDAIYAARLAVREINVAGGVGGWRLALVAYDDRADPELARSVARNLATDLEVVGVIGHYRQQTTEVAAPIYGAVETSLLVISAWITKTTAPAWHLAPSPRKMAEAMVAAGGGSDPNAISESRSVAYWGVDPLVSELEDVAALYGYRQLPIAPQLVLNRLDPILAAERLQQWASEDWSGMCVGGPELAAADFGTVVGEAGAGTRFITPYPFPRDIPDSEAWRAAYLAVGPHVPDPGPYALPTYEAVYLLAAAIAEAAEHGHVDRAGLAAVLPYVQRTGMLGHIAWDTDSYWSAALLYTYAWDQHAAHLVMP